MTWSAHTAEISLYPTSGAREQGNRGGKNDHNEAFKLLGLDTMQETLVVTLRNPSRSFPREAQSNGGWTDGEKQRTENRALNLNMKMR